MEMGLLYSYEEIHQVSFYLNSINCKYFPSFAGEFDMLESELNTLRFVSSWHSEPEAECDEDPDCVAILKECLLLIITISFFGFSRLVDTKCSVV